jgi:hypothetical protein
MQLVLDHSSLDFILISIPFSTRPSVLTFPKPHSSLDDLYCVMHPTLNHPSLDLIVAFLPFSIWPSGFTILAADCSLDDPYSVMQPALARYTSSSFLSLFRLRSGLLSLLCYSRIPHLMVCTLWCTTLSVILLLISSFPSSVFDRAFNAYFANASFHTWWSMLCQALIQIETLRKCTIWRYGLICLVECKAANLENASVKFSDFPRQSRIQPVWHAVR